MKLQPDFPERFGSIEDARDYGQASSTGSTMSIVTAISDSWPAAMHYGTAEKLTVQRAATLNVAFAAQPNRFKHIAPKPPELSTAVWINPPIEQTAHPPLITPNCSLRF
jgi:putative transposase